MAEPQPGSQGDIPPPGAMGAPPARGFHGAVLLWIAAALAGLLAALATLGFRALIQGVEIMATGAGGGLVAAAMRLPPWQRAFIAAAGGCGAGLVLHWGLQWAARGRQGAVHLDYIDAARQGKYRLNDRTTIVRSLSALVSVGTGAPIGREGPMVQLAAWLASWTARLLPLSEEHRNAILVCGVAAGMAAAYHAPIAGVVFVLELALGFLARHTVAPVLIASATSSTFIYWAGGADPLYVMPAVPVLPASLWLSVALGILCGGLAWLFLKLLEISRIAFGRIAHAPLRLGAGGVLVGLISAAVPQIWGNGYSVVSQVLVGNLDWTWVCVILLAKISATVLSSGSGAIGGVFTPTLFVGATSGFVIAKLAAGIGSAFATDPRAMAVIGMSAVLAAVTQAPLMAMVMVLEMTQQVQLTLPVMLACGIAYAISAHFSVQPLYGNPIEGHA